MAITSFINALYLELILRFGTRLSTCCLSSWQTSLRTSLVASVEKIEIIHLDNLPFNICCRSPVKKERASQGSRNKAKSAAGRKSTPARRKKPATSIKEEGSLPDSTIRLTPETVDLRRLHICTI